MNYHLLSNSTKKNKEGAKKHETYQRHNWQRPALWHN